MKKALWWGGAICAALCAMLIFTGCPPEEPEPPEPFTLTVTDIPSATPIVGASLLDENDIVNPIATGARSGNTFTFYHPGPDGRLPSSTPFNTSGKYLVALAEVDLQTFQETAVYFHCTNGDKTVIPFPISGSLSWADFEEEEP